MVSNSDSSHELANARRERFTVRELLTMACMAQSELLAGAGRIDRVITGLNIVEVPDVWRWLRGGELLFSSGFPWRENPSRLVEVMPALHRAGVSAIAFKLGQYVSELPAEVLAVADELGVPVLRLPKDLPYRDVIEPVYERLAGLRVGDRPLELKQKFTRFGLDDQSIEKIAGALAREVRHSVKVLDWLDETLYVADPDGIATVEPLSESDGAHALWDELRTQRLGRNPRPLRLSSGPVLASGLIVSHQTLGAMILEDVHEAPTQLLESELSYATELVSFLVLKRLAVLEGRREAASLFFRSLLNDSLSNEEAAERALTLGIRITQPCVIVVVGSSGVAASQELVRRLRSELERPTAPIHRVVCGDVPEGRLIALLQAEDVDVETVLADTASRLIDVGTDLGCDRIIVASGSARSGLAGVRRSKSEAQVAFNTARRMALRGLVRFGDLRVERLLSQIPDAEMMRDYVASVIGPLEENPELLHTLELYLQHGGNKVATAAALPLHRSSLMYRLRKISEALGTDPDDPERRLELWLALKLRTLLAL